MRAGDTGAETGQWKPVLGGAALWALLGGLSFVVGWYVGFGLGLEDMIVSWSGRGWFTLYGVSPWMLLSGLAYTGVLAFAVHRARLAGWRRAAGFAVLAMPWFVFAWNAGMAVYDIGGRMIGEGAEILEYVLAFLIWSGGLFAGGVWLALAALALLPSLRSRRSAARLLAAGAAFAVPAGIVAAVDFDAALDAMQFLFAGWCAVHAAVFAVTLRRAQSDDGGTSKQPAPAGDQPA